MSRTLMCSVLTGALAVLAAVGALGYRFSTELTGTVTTNRWLMIGIPLGAGLVAALLTAVLACFFRRRQAGAKGEILAWLLGLLAAAGIIAGGQYTPKLMAGPTAAKIAADTKFREVMNEDLLPEAQQTYDADEIAADLERLVLVGEKWLHAIFGEKATSVPSDQLVPVSVLPLLHQFGMVPYGDLIDAELQVRGWTAVPKPAGKLAYGGPNKDDIERLTKLKAKVSKLAGLMKARHEATQPKPVAWIGRWVMEYERQAGLIVIEEKKQPSAKVQIRDLLLLSSRLTSAISKLNKLKDEEKKAKGEPWSKVAQEIKKESIPDWSTGHTIVEAAIAAVETADEAQDVAGYLKEMAGLVPPYAYVAKHGKWWVSEGGLKPGFSKLQEVLAGGEWLKAVSSKPVFGPVLQAVVELRKALTDALANDNPPPGPVPPVPGGDQAVDRWTAEEIWETVYQYTGMEQWQDITIGLGGKRKSIVQAIRDHFNSDFKVGSPPRVHYTRYSRAGAMKVALGIVAKYVKMYAAEIAADWEARVAEVRKAKPNEAAGEVYPKRGMIRALFTEDEFWKSRLDTLKAILGEIGFPHTYKDGDGSKSYVDVPPPVAAPNPAVGGNSRAGRQNVAVEKVGEMVDQFVARLKEAASFDKDVDPKSLTEAGGWWAIFMASDKPGGINPITTLIRIRQGVPVNPPRNPDGSVAKKPDGTIDWTKTDPNAKRSGGVTKLGGSDYQALLNAREPLQGDEAEKPASAPAVVVTPPGSGDSVRTPE